VTLENSQEKKIGSKNWRGGDRGECAAKIWKTPFKGSAQEKKIGQGKENRTRGR